MSASTSVEEVVILPEAEQCIRDWVKAAKDTKEALAIYVGVDIGGTNTRIAVSSGKKGEVIRVCKFRAGTVVEVEKGLARIAELLSPQLQGESVSGAALGVAGRVFADRRGAEITNFGDTATGQEIHVRDLPAVLCPHDRTIFLNDLQCACYGMRALDAAGQLGDLFAPLWPADAPEASLEPHHYIVMAMGTGLGNAFLLSNPNGDGFTVMPLEAGHAIASTVGAAHPDYADDQAMIAYLSKKLYNSKTGIEYEDVCSGRGLENVYDYLASLDDSRPAASAPEIAKLVEEGDKVARKALLIHYKWFARCTRMLAMISQARGVFWAGNNQFNNADFVREHLDELRGEILNSTKPAWFESLKVYTQKQLLNINLWGCLFVAQTQQL